jgi:hypothetical protein
MVVPISVATPNSAALRRALRNAQSDVRKGFYRAMNTALKPVKEEVTNSALSNLPKRGGLNKWGTRITYKTQVAYAGPTTRVTLTAMPKAKVVTKKIAGKRRKVRKPFTFGTFPDLRALERGRIMHPYMGRKNASGVLYGPQMVKPGFFSDVMKGPVAARAKLEMSKELDSIAETLARSAR